MKKLNYIAFVSVPVILKEGITSILNNKLNVKTFDFNSLKEIENYTNKKLFHLIIINSDIPENETKDIPQIRTSIPNIKIIGLISNSPNRSFSLQVDNKIYLNDSSSKIVKIVEHCLSDDSNSSSKTAENKLTEREIEILKLLAIGKSNKETADALFISIHTVISHRKNIIKKLGIKSTAAMAIYAVANNLIDINDNLNLFK